MSSKILFILKIVVIVVLVAAVAGAGVFFGIKYFKNKDKDKNEDNTPTNPNPIFSTNSYNEAISANKLVTVNYSGTYEFSIVNSVKFNEKSENNPNGLTQNDIDKLFSRYVNEGGMTEFCNYLNDKKKEEVLESNEYITIVTPTDSNGKVSSSGIYTKNTKLTALSGVVYGDENLAVAVINDSKDCEFFSLNYTNMYDAIKVTSNTKPQQNILYVFRDVYSSSYPDLLLFTITYEYKLIVEENSIPSKDLVFDI